MRFTKTDLKEIRDFCKEVTGYGNVAIEMGIRCSCDTGSMVENCNIRLVDPTEDWEESDLLGMMNWSDVRGHDFELTPEGAGISDLYLYHAHDGLMTNVFIEYNEVGLVRMESVVGQVWNRS